MKVLVSIVMPNAPLELSKIPSHDSHIMQQLRSPEIKHSFIHISESRSDSGLSSDNGSDCSSQSSSDRAERLTAIEKAALTVAEL